MKEGHIETLISVLSDAISVLDRERIDHLVIGSVAAVSFGIPRDAGDIDLFIRAEDSEAAQKALIDAGFELEHTDLDWLRKVRRNGILVDLICEIQEKMVLDTPMLERSSIREVGGLSIRVAPVEDFTVMQAASHSEDTPHYWGNGVGALLRQDIDWDYLLERSRHSAKRMLSLLIYAQSDDVLVPDNAIRELFRSIYGEGT